VSSRNAYRGGVRSMLNGMSELLREQGGALNRLGEAFEMGLR
jgi:hypothetical protein